MAFNNTSKVSTSYNESLVQFFKTVFNYMTGGVALAGLTAYITLHSPALLTFALQANIILALIWMFSGFFIYKMIEKASVTGGLVTFIVYSIWTGLTFAPIFLMYTGADITTAFIVTSCIFGFMSLFGFSTKKSLSGWAIGLRMAGWGLFAAVIVNIIMALFGFMSQSFSLLLSFLIVPFIAAVVGYEVNQLKEFYSNFEHDETEKTKIAIIGATSLFSSFVVMFLHILRIIGIFSND